MSYSTQITATTTSTRPSVLRNNNSRLKGLGLLFLMLSPTVTGKLCEPINGKQQGKDVCFKTKKNKYDECCLVFNSPGIQVCESSEPLNVNFGIFIAKTVDLRNCDPEHPKHPQHPEL